MSAIGDADLAALNVATRMRLLDAQHRVIGEAQLGEFSRHGDSAWSSLIAGVKLDGEPSYIELLDDDERVIHRGPVTEDNEVEALTAMFRRALNGDAR